MTCFVSQAAAFADHDGTRRQGSRAENAARSSDKTGKAADSDVVVRYLDKKTNGLNVAETPNFRILYDADKNNLDNDIVQKVGDVAEKSRAALQKKWFGDVSADWDGKCSIYLHGTLKDYTGKTKQKNALGHMRTLDWSGMFARSIHVPALESNMATDVLPHEVCHSVMSVRFQGNAPRWADEGMAILSESPLRHLEFQLLLAKYHKEDALFSLEVLMNTKESEHMDTLEYYAQSLSLVKFFCERKGYKKFTDFVRTSIQKGYEPALKECYDVQGYNDLERQWQDYAFRAKKSQ